MRIHLLNDFPVKIPDPVEEFLQWLKNYGYGVWIVGGAVRDVLLGMTPKDWDIATDAPVDILLSSPYKAFEIGARFGVIHIVLGHFVVEVVSLSVSTPDSKIETDLARRDFTINAMAVSYEDGLFIDPYNGREDLGSGVIRGVINPEDRFLEDPIRIVRAARFMSTYSFKIDRSVYKAMTKKSLYLQETAVERIKDEFFELLVGKNVKEGIEVLRKSGALRFFFPELLEGWRKKQNEHHRYHIYRHILETVAAAPPRLRVRLAALFHDIAKPRTRIKRDGRFRFFGHEMASAKLARDVMERWKVSRKLIEEVSVLITNHMVNNIETWSDGAVRRLMIRIGPDLMDDFLDLLKADRVAHGANDDGFYMVNALKKRIEEQRRAKHPVGLKSLALNGLDVMEAFHIKPGPLVGRLLEALHTHVIDHPEDNTKERLLEIAQQKFPQILEVSGKERLL